jgi:Flp pilus assembly protein TadB
MIIKKEDNFKKLKENILNQKKILKEISPLKDDLEKVKSIEERKMILTQKNSLKNSFKKINEDISKTLNKISLNKPLNLQIKKDFKINTKPKLPEKRKPVEKIKKPVFSKKKFKDFEISELERITIKRLKKGNKKIVKKKVKKASNYVKVANKFFSGFYPSFSKKDMFRTLKRDLIKANLQFIPASYISVILFTTFLSIIISIFVFLFFMIFNIGPELPILTLSQENILDRLLKTFWIIFVIPIITFLAIYSYPSAEKKSIGSKIDQELPFATIHMSAISGSMVNPGEIFKIIASTKEYPYLEKEFIKIINEMNIYGYDLVTALRNIAFNSPSKRLTDLLNGLATTINSGGNLTEFFDKRSQSLLFEHRLEKEKQTKAAETFMDIYISVVIAAPMILMLLMMMMKISGLGISISTKMIGLIMIVGVTIINAIFLTFLHLKQPSE